MAAQLLCQSDAKQMVFAWLVQTLVTLLFKSDHRLHYSPILERKASALNNRKKSATVD